MEVTDELEVTEPWTFNCLLTYAVFPLNSS